ncbi:MAG: glycosyltransferase family 4 protein [Methylobacterium mesophilicum]|nr:glycosyltransferase family 4 protein [Methylobacterium mesophilicum]
MHILFLSDNFPPETNAPAGRTFEHAREWVRAGHSVTVITGAPNFPKGELFPGYRNRLWQEEWMEGIRVVRLWTFIAPNQGRLRRTLDYLSFMTSAILAAPFIRNVDVVVGTSPQFFTACAAWVAASLKRAPFVFELRDLWPASIRAVGALPPGLALRWLEGLELFLYRRAAGIVAVTHAFRDNLARRGIDRTKISVVTNGADLSLFSPRAPDSGLLESLGISGRFVSGYIGTHGMAHGLDTVLEAARLLDERAPGRHAVLMLGEGARKARLKARALREGIRNVVFVDAVPKGRVPDYWALLDISVIHLRRDPVFREVIPSKLFEATAMGVPVVLGLEGEAAEIVERHEIGVTVEPENAQAMAEAVVALANDAERRATVRANALRVAPGYERKQLAGQMLDVLAEVVAHRAPRRRPSATRRPWRQRS